MRRARLRAAPRQGQQRAHHCRSLPSADRTRALPPVEFSFALLRRLAGYGASDAAGEGGGGAAFRSGDWPPEPPAQLGRARVSGQPHPLQQARPRRALRGLGAAPAVHRRAPSWLQVATRVIPVLATQIKQVAAGLLESATSTSARRGLARGGLSCPDRARGRHGRGDLRRRGRGRRGPEGEPTRTSAFDIDVVDTTGCGDAFSAGLVIGLGLGRYPREAAVLGCASAALVAGGLGSNHGDFDHDTADALAAATPCGR